MGRFAALRLAPQSLSLCAQDKEMNIGYLPLIILFAWVFVAVFIAKTINKEVSRERLLSVEDLSSLWKGNIPPFSVLTDKGRQFKFWLFVASGIVIVISILLAVFVTGLPDYPIEK